MRVCVRAGVSVCMRVCARVCACVRVCVCVCVYLQLAFMVSTAERVERHFECFPDGVQIVHHSLRRDTNTPSRSETYRAEQKRAGPDRARLGRAELGRLKNHLSHDAMESRVESIPPPGFNCPSCTPSQKPAN